MLHELLQEYICCFLQLWGTCMQLALQRCHLLVRDPTGHDAVKVGQIVRHIQRRTMPGDAMGYLYTNGCYLTLSNPHSRSARYPALHTDGCMLCHIISCRKPCSDIHRDEHEETDYSPVLGGRTVQELLRQCPPAPPHRLLHQSSGASGSRWGSTPAVRQSKLIQWRRHCILRASEVRGSITTEA